MHEMPTYKRRMHVPMEYNNDTTNNKVYWY